MDLNDREMQKMLDERGSSEMGESQLPKDTLAIGASALNINEKWPVFIKQVTAQMSMYSMYQCMYVCIWSTFSSHKPIKLAYVNMNILFSYNPLLKSVLNCFIAMQLVDHMVLINCYASVVRCTHMLQ